MWGFFFIFAPYEKINTSWCSPTGDCHNGAGRPATDNKGYYKRYLQNRIDGGCGTPERWRKLYTDFF